jgi:subtilisin-like proprotein convertase family protein
VVETSTTCTVLIPGLPGHIIRSSWPGCCGKHVGTSSAPVIVIDTGIDVDHEHLESDWQSDLSKDAADSDSNPRPDSTAERHGTAAAGLAIGDPSECGTGYAPDADWGAVRLIAGSVTQIKIASAFDFDDAAVFSNSWGPQDLNTFSSASALSYATFQDLHENGFGGTGANIVFAGGNGRVIGDNSNKDVYTASVYTTAVGATRGGTVAYYSENGANLLVVAEEGAATTDIQPGGYNSGSVCTASFSGTSSTTPQVAGLIGQIRGANTLLGPRDVEEILVHTSTKPDALHDSWRANMADFLVSETYGHGQINADSAIRLALSLNASDMPAVVSETYGPEAVGETIADLGSAVCHVIDVPPTSEVAWIEYVEVELDVTHTYIGDLVIDLWHNDTSFSQLIETPSSVDDGTDIPFPLSSTMHWGEAAEGNWTVCIEDEQAEDSGTWNTLTLTFYGRNETLDLSTPPFDMVECKPTEIQGAAITSGGSRPYGGVHVLAVMTVIAMFIF